MYLQWIQRYKNYSLIIQDRAVCASMIQWCNTLVSVYNLYVYHFLVLSDIFHLNFYSFIAAIWWCWNERYGSIPWKNLIWNVYSSKIVFGQMYKSSGRIFAIVSIFELQFYKIPTFIRISIEYKKINVNAPNSIKLQMQIQNPILYNISEHAIHHTQIER